ncbi:MFS transporter [Halapricum hydrolyticum]|uniref:MFS transporter n=1 Tax=Halapricum hydrolyticum TaxID=2979991 RepID=A0AAE3LGZ6_9EURY|nr:MFS transporter [Halapricum hydrolyticum]MCU4718170.1 MFS transporter [Halapricum hydrolyticum]MCU4726389.1 MFS transporter [Halapricum hydrolyticum]
MASSQAATSEQAAPAAAPGTRRRVAVVVGIVFIDLLGFGIIIPILPFYVRSFGVSDVFIGLLAASYSLAQFVAAPVLGRISDERGRRPVLMLSVGVSGIAWVVFGFASEIGAALGVTLGLVVLFSARLLAGAAGGNIAAAQAYIADVTTPADRTGALGLVGAAFGLGFVFGPAIGGLLASDTAVSTARTVLPGFVPVTPFSLPSFAAAGFSFLALGVAAAVLKEPNRTRTQARRVSFVGQFRTALADATLRPLVIAFFLTSLAFAGVTVMFVPFMADAFGYDATEAAIFLAYIGALGIVNQGVLIGWLSRRFSVQYVVRGGVTSLFLALVLLAVSPLAGTGPLAASGPGWVTGGLLVLLAFGALASFGNGAITVGLAALVSKGATDDTQGAAFGVTQGAGSLGRTVGPPLAAAAYVVVDWSPFVAGALLLVPVAVLLRR